MLELIPALAAREPTSAYLFYDCQTDDSRLVLTVLGEAERFGAVCVNGAPVVELIEEGGRAAGVVCVEQEIGRALCRRGRERRERDRRVGGPDPARGAARRGGRAGDPPQPRDAHPDRPRAPADERGGDRAGRGGAHDLRAAVARARPWSARPTTTTRGASSIPEVARADVEYLLKAVNSFFETDFGPDDLAGAYAGVRR